MSYGFISLSGDVERCETGGRAGAFDHPNGAQNRVALRAHDGHVDRETLPPSIEEVGRSRLRSHAGDDLMRQFGAVALVETDDGPQDPQLVAPSLMFGVQGVAVDIAVRDPRALIARNQVPR